MARTETWPKPTLFQLSRHLVSGPNEALVLDVLLHPTPLLFATGELIPLRGLEGVPGLHGAPQDEAGLARKFETSPVACAPC